MPREALIPLRRSMSSTKLYHQQQDKNTAFVSSRLVTEGGQLRHLQHVSRSPHETMSRMTGTAREKLWHRNGAC
jgi:hypothetical protein